MTLNDAEIAALCETFRTRAETYMRKAAEANTFRDVVMFTAFVSTLEWAAREIHLTARLSTLTKADVEGIARQRRLADEAHGEEDTQP
jgi:hypothetical protein